MNNLRDTTCNKTALVTGASRGIGASVARQLARARVKVGINYRSKGARTQEIADEIVASGKQVLLLQADITDLDEVKAMFAQIKAVWSEA